MTEKQLRLEMQARGCSLRELVKSIIPKDRQKQLKRIAYFIAEDLEHIAKERNTTVRQLLLEL